MSGSRWRKSIVQARPRLAAFSGVMPVIGRVPQVVGRAPERGPVTGRDRRIGRSLRRSQWRRRSASADDAHRRHHAAANGVRRSSSSMPSSQCFRPNRRIQTAAIGTDPGRRAADRDQNDERESARRGRARAPAGAGSARPRPRCRRPRRDRRSGGRRARLGELAAENAQPPAASASASHRAGGGGVRPVLPLDLPPGRRIRSPAPPTRTTRGTAASPASARSPPKSAPPLATAASARLEPGAGPGASRRRRRSAPAVPRRTGRSSPSVTSTQARCFAAWREVPACRRAARARRRSSRPCSALREAARRAGRCSGA